MSTPEFDAAFAPFAARMTAAGVPALAISTFKAHYRALRSGDTGQISESAISPVPDLPDADTLPSSLTTIGEAALEETVFVKLNGGLGTSMGLQGAKSLLPVRGD